MPRDTKSGERDDGAAENASDGLAVVRAALAAPGGERSLEKACAALRRLLGVDLISVYLADAERRHLRVVASDGLAVYAGLEVDGPGLIARAFREDRPVFSADVWHDPTYVAVDARVQAECATPLRAAERVVGVLNAEATDAARLGPRARRILGEAALAVESWVASLAGADAAGPPAAGGGAVSIGEALAVLEALPLPVAVARWSDRRILFANHAATGALGTPASALMGRDVRELCSRHEDCDALVAEVEAAGVARGRDLTLGLDGTGTHRVSASACRAWLRGKAAFIVCFQPLGAARADEDRVRRDRDRCQTLLAAVPDLVFNLSRDGRILDCHLPARESLGKTPRELLGHSLDEVLPPDATGAPSSTADAGRVGGLPGALTRRLLAPGRQPRHFDALVTRAANGESRVVARDVTEARLTSRLQSGLLETVRRQAHDWQALFDGIDQAVLVVDKEAATISRLNRAACELAALPRAQAIGARVSDLGAAQPWPTARLLLEHAAAAPGAILAEIAADSRKDRHWEVTVGRFDGASGDASVRLLLAIRDVTRVVRLERAVRDAESAARLRRLVSSVAHEVRNPLFAITATAEALAVRLEHDHRLVKEGAMLRSEAGRLLRSMTDLFDYSRPESLELIPDRLVEAARLAAERCQGHASRRQIHIVECERPGAGSVRMDRERLAQAIARVVENAVQHGPPGSVVAVVISPEPRNGRPGVLLSVRDAGPGFAPEDLLRAFEPFYTTHRGRPGLGLALAQRIVGDHGGSIEASNVTGGGALVSVWLPATAGD